MAKAVCLFFSMWINLNAQIKISGFIIDSVSKKPVSFVDLKVENKRTHFITDKFGFFALELPIAYLDDTISFSISGYKEFKLRMKS